MVVGDISADLRFQLNKATCEYLNNNQLLGEKPTINERKAALIEVDKCTESLIFCLKQLDSASMVDLTLASGKRRFHDEVVDSCISNCSKIQRSAKRAIEKLAAIGKDHVKKGGPRRKRDGLKLYFAELDTIFSKITGETPKCPTETHNKSQMGPGYTGKFFMFVQACHESLNEEIALSGDNKMQSPTLFAQLKEYFKHRNQPEKR